MGTPAPEDDITKQPANGDTAGDAPATPETPAEDEAADEAGQSED